MSAKFWLGEEKTLEHEHIGKILYVEHYSAKPSQTVYGLVEENSWTRIVHVGTLVGFAEDHGRITSDAVASPPDEATEFPNFECTLFFAHGASIRVRQNDRCSIYTPTPNDRFTR